MAFEGLTEKLSAAFKKLRGKGRLSEADVKEAMREIRLALLEADVSYKVVKQFIAQVTEKAVGADVLEALSPAQQIVKIVNQELTDLMGGESTKLTIASKPPTVVMMVGLQGAGKTTNCAKLAGLMKRKEGKRPLLAACDIYRPAAIQQLEVVGKQLDIPVLQMGQTDPVDIAKAAIAHAREHGNDLVFLDTAGRLHVDEELMDELRRIKAAVEPTEILLVVDAMIGQDAVNAAKAFDDALDIDGVVPPSWTATPEGARHCPSRRSPASPSSLPAWAKSWIRLRSSTPTAWPAASWAWATCSPSLRRRSRTSTRRRPWSFRRSCGKTNLPSPISMSRWLSFKIWAPSPSWRGCSPA